MRVIHKLGFQPTGIVDHGELIFELRTGERAQLRVIHKLGFQPTGIVDDGELIFELRTAERA